MNNNTQKACRICLAIDRKLYNMEECTLYVYYEELTGLTTKDELPQKLCWECFYRLLSFKKLKNKALHSYNLMLNMLRTSSHITDNDISLIDRLKYNLISNLTEQIHKPNHTDYQIGHNDRNFEKFEILQTDVEDLKNEEISVYDQDYDTDIHNFEVTQTDTLGLKDEDIERIEDQRVCVENFKIVQTDLLKDEGILEIEGINDNAELCNEFNNSKQKMVRKKVDRRRKPAKDVIDEDIFEIIELNYVEQVNEIERRRESSNFNRSEYKCMDCFKGFLDKEAFNGHVLRHTAQGGLNVCEICKIRFHKNNSLRSHIMKHKQKFSCKKCAYTTNSRQAAKLHEKYHSGTRYDCPHCKENFTKFTTYMSHVRIKHASDFVCVMCGHSFVSDKGLYLHKKLKHRYQEISVPENGPKCTECDLKFATTEAIDNHLKQSPKHNHKNSRKRNRINPIDQKTSQENIKKDKIVNKTDKTMPRLVANSLKPHSPISCEQCDQQLADSISYYRHFRREHPEKNRTNYPSMKSKCMCEVCGKMFQSLAILQDHSYTHDEGLHFPCPVCGKRFKRKYRLIAHGRVHSAERAYHACHLCDKRYSSSANLHRHMFIHTGLKPFKCEMCGKCFKHDSEKKAHVSYVHFKKPWPKRNRGKQKTESRQEHVTSPITMSTQPSDAVQPLWATANNKIVNTEYLL